MAGRLLPLLVAGASTVAALSNNLPVKLETRTAVTSRLANVYVDFARVIGGEVLVTYGSCISTSPEQAHHVLGKTEGGSATRLVWVLPVDTDSNGCISAWDSSNVLVGRSEPQLLHQRHKRRAEKRAVGIAMNNATGIDTLGPWFDGVELLKNREPGPVDVKAAKAKEVAIVGAGMSGLMSYLVLSQAGMKSIKIIEAGGRLGGRVHTEYLTGGPFNYSYQEMGPMRFPWTYTDPATKETVNISDHRLVYQLAEELNSLNKHSKNLSVDFIPWIQSNPNGLVYNNGFKLPSGLPPTVAQISANPAYGAPTRPLDNSTIALAAAVQSYLPGPEFNVEMAKNMFKAHKDWQANGLKGLGGDVWSEFAFMVNYLGGSLNDTDVIGGGSETFWDALYDTMYFSAGTWKTIDGGLNRLPLAFHPLVDNVTSINKKIERVQFATQNGKKKVNLQWRDDFKSQKFHTESYDYAVITAPFTIVRKWRLPQLPTTISNAINNLNYVSACKVALEFSERFWEHYDNPIVGGCSTTTDIPGIASICYPSYNINGSGPATMLASYSSGDWAERWVASNETEHVQYVLDAMIEIHGDKARKLYTGKFNRRCWLLDPLTSGDWASPTVGQHRLYIPEYFKTYDGLIFVGEHTSYTHAWIASALESGIRGSVQLLLELGLVDEAKATVEKWMARWIDI
ncbi:flavin-containing amine oxidoreductase-domain containing protein [Lasiosphaeria ovina]|uniref:Flavin-containing amine oxidoreductase-domain containing protein n=1 Tax=Lasiosphaeria ovina TaxID=92902 RepID=A0AAE0NBM7_9PEZI|nr:flavin-containing amine oxidoreductase-domain containing protein [Lasiosphaeria ovina]